MLISIIAAMSKNRVIGKDNVLPWHLPADLKHFKKLTLGKPIIMGRKTYASIGKPLPERHNIIITRESNLELPGCTVVNSVEEALQAAGDCDEVMVIGGCEIYKQFLPLANRLYLTLVHSTIEGDTFFPELDETKWEEVSRENFEADEKNSYTYSFLSCHSRESGNPGSLL